MAERLKSFYTMNNFFQNLTGYTQIVLKSGQYLSEALIAHGVPLIPRESDCETIEIDLPTSGEMVNK
jgi:hypothetical protein